MSDDFFLKCWDELCAAMVEEPIVEPDVIVHGQSKLTLARNLDDGEPVTLNGQPVYYMEFKDAPCPLSEMPSS